VVVKYRGLTQKIGTEKWAHDWDCTWECGGARWLPEKMIFSSILFHSQSFLSQQDLDGGDTDRSLNCHS
jgi:hypothetical protein